MTEKQIAKYIHKAYFNKTYDPKMLYKTGIWKHAHDMDFREGSMIVMWIKGQRVEIRPDQQNNYYNRSYHARVNDTYIHDDLIGEIWRDYHTPKKENVKTHDDLRDEIGKIWGVK